MKKSRLGDLFNEDSGSSDKSLLTYHRPHQPGVGRTSADSPPPETSNSPSSTSKKHIPDVAPPLTEKSQERSPLATEKPQERSPPATGTGTSRSLGNTASTTDSMTAPELLHSCVVSAFTFSGSQSVSVGSLGCALYWEPSRHRSLLVLYRSRQQQICLLTLTPTSLPAVQPRLYVSFRCDAGRQFSVHLASQSALREFAMKTVLAAALAAAAVGGSPAALTLPVEDEASSSGGRRARVGDSLQLEVTEWSVQKPRSEPLRQRGATSSVSATLDGSWRAALRGGRPGQRWLVADPATLEFVREVLAVAVRPPPRQAPLQLPADGGTDWQPGDEAGSLSPESPPSPPPSPSLPAVDVDQAEIDARAHVEEESDPRDGPEEGEATPAASAPARGRADVLARMARLGQQMFPSAADTGRGQSPSPPPSPPPSPARRSPSPAARNVSPRPQSPSPSNRQTSIATTAAVEAAGVIKASAGSKPAVAARRPPGRLPPGPRPPVAPRSDSTELGVLFGRLEAKLETVLSRLEPPAVADADAETLVAGVRKLAAENAALRESSRRADRATELRLESERARAAMATELADSLAELTETKRKLANAKRRLATVEDTASEAAAAGKRETELEAQLAAAMSAAAAAKGSADTAEAAVARAAREPRRLLRAVYKTLRSRLPVEATFTGSEVGEILAEVVREALQMVETETETVAGWTEGQAETQAVGEGGGDKETRSRRGSVPPFVTEDECIEKGDE